MSLPELAATPWGATSLACEALALAGMAPFLYIEAATLREYGPGGWLSTWNIMDVIAYAVQARPCSRPVQDPCSIAQEMQACGCLRVHALVA